MEETRVALLQTDLVLIKEKDHSSLNRRIIGTFSDPVGFVGKLDLE